MKNENENEYLIEENDFGKTNKRRVPFLLVVSIAALVLALSNWIQLIIKLIDESYTSTKNNFLYTGIISTIIFVLFLLLFAIIRTKGKGDLVSKKDEPSTDSPNKNVEVVDGFVDLVEDETYLQAEEEEEASNKKEEVEDVDTFNLTTKLISDRLTASFHNHSLHCDTNYLTAALSATNLLFVSKNDQDESEVLKSIAGGMGGKEFLVDVQNLKSKNDLLYTSGFLPFIDESNNNLNKLYFVGFKNISLESITNILEDFLEALYDRNNSSRIDLNIDNKVDSHIISQNLYFILFNKDGEKFLSLPANLLKYSIAVNLAIKSIPFEKADFDESPISYYDFKRAVNYCLTTDFLSENRWTKIDELASYLNQKKPYMISNDVLNNIESFSSVLLSLGTKKDVTFDRVCADILLPSILKDFGREHIVGDGGIYHYINDNFANVYTLPKTETLIKDARYLNKDENASAPKDLFEEFEKTIKSSPSKDTTQKEKTK